MLLKLDEIILRNKNSEDEIKNKEYFMIAGKILLEFSESIKTNYPELKDFCREIFRDILYSFYDISKQND